MSKFPFHQRHCGHSEVIAEVCPLPLTTTMIFRGLGRYVALDVYVPVISRCEDLGMCFELYGILASDEHSEDRVSVMTTFFESLDAEVERINVADFCEQSRKFTPSTRLVATLRQQVSLPAAEVEWIRTEAVTPPFEARSTLVDLRSWCQEQPL